MWLEGYGFDKIEIVSVPSGIRIIIPMDEDVAKDHVKEMTKLAKTECTNG